MREKRYRNEGFCVLPKSKKDIRLHAEDIRRLFFPVEHKLLDVTRLVEHKLPDAFEGFRYEILPDELLPGREAEFSPFDFCIRIRESVYVGSCNGNGHCRFTLAHELGHFFMHRNQPMAFGRSAANDYIPLYRNSEWQADKFARCLLAPVRLAKGLSAAAIATVFEVSAEVAHIVRREAVAMFGDSAEITEKHIQRCR